ncbi:GGDEF domain-containing protein [Vagococcus fluvialis]|uniref:GGDEF domain-containing protein n=1 Tax=Vagococcus fluvialis TaxID=2738 RepID=UPI003B5AB8E3
MIFPTIDAFIINLAIIISVILGLYFYSLKASLKNDDLDTDFFIISNNLVMSKPAQIISGIFVGIMAFVISNHGIPVAEHRPVDVRYLPVYFSVFYGSPLIGTFTAITLVTAKCIQYTFVDATSSEFIHNILITFFILIVSIVINKNKINPKKAIILCLTLTLMIRSIFVFIVFYPHFSFNILLEVLTNFSIFSLFFLFTGWLIHRAIIISEGIHVYRTSSVFDSLTGLYNKESFYFFLDLAYNEAIYDGRAFSLAIIDLDNFKLINDTFGHLVGDEILKQTALQLRGELDPESRIRVCRIGGDEFAIVFKHEVYDSTEFFKQLFTDLEALDVPEKLISYLSLSVGLIDFTPSSLSSKPYHTENVQDLFQLADQALYEAKASGKNQVVQKNVHIQMIKKHR